MGGFYKSRRILEINFTLMIFCGRKERDLQALLFVFVLVRQTRLFVPKFDASKSSKTFSHKVWSLAGKEKANFFSGRPIIAKLSENWE